MAEILNVPENIPQDPLKGTRTDLSTPLDQEFVPNLERHDRMCDTRTCNTLNVRAKFANVEE